MKSNQTVVQGLLSDLYHRSTRRAQTVVNKLPLWNHIKETYFCQFLAIWNHYAQARAGTQKAQGDPQKQTLGVLSNGLLERLSLVTFSTRCDNTQDFTVSLFWAGFRYLDPLCISAHALKSPERTRKNRQWEFSVNGLPRRLSPVIGYFRKNVRATMAVSANICP